jgi:hypothetical protein
MKRKLKITIKEDHNHYALIEQVNNRENEINRGIFLDKDQYEQLRQHFVSGSLPLDSEVINNCPQGSFGTREVWMRGVVWLKEYVLKGNDR